MDWGVGTYEVTAAQLAPVALAAVEHARIEAGMRVLDVACGTGNAAIEAAHRGGEVTGLDAAPRLLEVARERAAEEGLPITFDHGDALALPYEDDAFDVVLSVFGVIFARPPETAAAELRRVLRPGGRLVFSAWKGEGPIDRSIQAAMRSIADLLPEGIRPGQPSPWTDEQRLRELLAPLAVELLDEGLVFEGASPEAFNAEWFEQHPMWLGMQDGVPAERYAQARETSLQALVAGNEARDGEGFRATSPYRLVVADAPS